MSITFDLPHLEPVATAKFTLAGVFWPTTNPTPITLIGRHSGDSNDAWVAACKNNELQRHATDEQGKQWYEKMLKAFARTVLTGWEDVLDAEGKPVPYDPASGAALLIELFRRGRRVDMLQPMLVYFADPVQFCAAPPVDADDLGKK